MDNEERKAVKPDGAQPDRRRPGASRGELIAAAKRTLLRLAGRAPACERGLADVQAVGVALLIDDLADALAYCREVSRLGGHLDAHEWESFIDVLVNPAYTPDAPRLFRKLGERGHERGGE